MIVRERFHARLVMRKPEGPSFARDPNRMNPIYRKDHSTAMVSALYLALVGFALLCTFGLL